VRADGVDPVAVEVVREATAWTRRWRMRSDVVWTQWRTPVDCDSVDPTAEDEERCGLDWLVLEAVGDAAAWTQQRCSSRRRCRKIWQLGSV
jgi:hypothetical protein